MTMMRRVLVAATICLMLCAARPAAARCPQSGWPSKDSCQAVDAFFMPGLIALSYFPTKSGIGNEWFGAGVQIVPFLWSHNTEKFGPGQGKLIFDIGMLGGEQDGVGRMLLYRFGGQLSFERNASRQFAIPFFGIMMGGIQQELIQHVGFVETTLGIHAVFMKNVTVTLEGGYLFPFQRVDQLAGYRGTFAVNFTMW